MLVEHSCYNCDLWSVGVWQETKKPTRYLVSYNNIHMPGEKASKNFCNTLVLTGD